MMVDSALPLAEFTCPGCGTKDAAGIDLAGVPSPPVGWVSLSCDRAMAEPPYAERVEPYTTVACSLSCADSTFTRIGAESRLRVTPAGLPQFSGWVPPSRADIARELGYIVLEAIEDLTEGVSVILPLTSLDERFETGLTVVVTNQVEYEEPK